MTLRNRTLPRSDNKNKTCFVISRIGKEDDEIRNYADVVFEFIKIQAQLTIQAKVVCAKLVDVP